MCAARQSEVEPEPLEGDRPASRSQAIGAVFAAACAHVAPARLHGSLKRLLPRRYSAPPVSEIDALTALALDLLMFAPDPKGRTAFDRLHRGSASRFSAAEREALELLRRAQFAVLRIDTRTTGEWFRAVDVLSGVTHTLALNRVAPGDVVAVRLAATPEGQSVPAGMVLGLPNGTADIPTAQIARNGDAFRNPNRAAEAIYRRVVETIADRDGRLGAWLVHHPTLQPRGGIVFADGRLQLPSDTPEEVHELTALSAQWAAVDSADPTAADPEGTRWLRRLAGPETVYTLLSLAEHVPEGHPQQRALEAMAAVVLDTVEFRADAGLGPSMAEFDAELSAERPLPAELRARLRRLQQSMNGQRGTAHREDRDRVVARIRALQAKTRDAGCTEAEAMAAAAKAEELLRRYDVTLTPEQLADQDCKLVRLPTPRKRFEGLDDCTPAIADFCECWTWTERADDDRLTHVFFGMPTDVEAAQTLFTVVAATFATETRNFKAGRTYAETPGNLRGQATRSFRLGLASGIQDKLAELQTARAHQTQATTGRDLVPVKTRAIEMAFERLGLSLQGQAGRGRFVDPESYRQGIASGRAFQPDPGVEQPAPRAASPAA